MSGPFKIERPDPWTPIYNQLVEEHWHRRYESVPIRYATGLGVIPLVELQRRINESARQLAVITDTPTFIPMRGTR
jgi:hypothetical protein